MLGKYHGSGDIYNPTVQFEYAEIKETLRLVPLPEELSIYRLYQDSRESISADYYPVAGSLFSVVWHWSYRLLFRHHLQIRWHYRLAYPTGA